MDLSNLNDGEVFYLIKRLKVPQSVLEFNQVYTEIVTALTPGLTKARTIVLDETENIQYILDIFDSGRPPIFSILIRFKDDPHHLVRIDFGDNLRHTNKFGTDDEYVVLGAHMHVYALPGKNAPKDVIPIEDVSEFKNVKTIAEAYKEFLVYVNIQRGKETP